MAAAALAAAAAVALAACGSSSGSGSGSSDSGPGSKSVAQGGKDFGTAAKDMNGFGTSAKPGQFPRTITQAMGRTTLKKRPTRVVVLDVGELDNVVSLGIKPVGVAYTEGSEKMPSYLKAEAGNPKNVGTISNLNLEAINNLHPDLILGSKLRAEKQYATLSKIAPTVFSIRPGYTWKQNYLLNAAALDKTAEAESKLAAYQKEAKAVGAAIKEKNHGTMPTVSMVRYLPDRIRLYANQSFIGTILKDTGVPRPKNQDVNELAVEVSPEKIDQADADWIFTGVYGPADKTQKAQTRSNALWKNLKAVKDGHAKDVSDETWYLGLGVTAADSVLKDLRGYLAS
ncbi:ABC transporter substrate-binding protein [Mangrovactinospora gilvigrisea]|uniref:ABC transporter substrate-binding protein n=1 Tax=Mangrovactinospora gilvigrisea TaxID=1428644 RepID=A0A1J7BCZ4_9ACTN|nr:iron-siderophore ABC transporter substrate-binding protein [Mangrovactinospora gilvigrisea]OIV36526.1 ABC transporter substrate-binding protein [Mangrovactinospora gilvigrisea]